MNILYNTKKEIPFLLSIYIIVFLALVLLVVVNVRTGIPIAYLTRDPAAAVEAPFYTGIFSSIGILLWCSAAAICLFSAGILHSQSDEKDLTTFILCSGLLTTALLLDDLFLLHEEVLPTYFHIPQKLVFVLYGVLFLIYTIVFRNTILNKGFLIFGTAIASFGLSVIVDNLPIHDVQFNLIAEGFPGYHLLEDGFKFMGIVSWSTYFIKLCVEQVRSMFR